MPYLFETEEHAALRAQARRFATAEIAPHAAAWEEACEFPRALYGAPRLLVLDEPNANLDSEGEQALGVAVRQAKSRGATVVLISHRPSLIAHADRILFLREGRIEMLGPRAQVLDRLRPRPEQVVRPVMQAVEHLA